MPNREIWGSIDPVMPIPCPPYHLDELVTPDVIADPYPAYRRLRDRSPARYLYIPDGALADCPDDMQAWAVMGYDDVRWVLQDHGTFSSQRPLAGRMMSRLVLLQDDPPRHTGFRRLVRGEFTSDRLAKLEPEIGRIATDLLDHLPGDEIDFVSAFAAPLPIRVIARLIGLPESDHPTYRRWSETALSVLSVTDQRKSQDRADMERFFGQMIAAARGGDRSGTLLDILANGRIDDAPLREWEVIGFCILLLVAGSETTTNLLGNMFALLARRPDLWDRLRQHRTLVTPFIAEALRYESPLQRLSRTATRDVEIGSARISSGDTVVAFIGAANRDPAKFSDPDRFELDRPQKEPLAFGSGIHYCLGAALARMEAAVALNALLDRYSGVEAGPGRTRRQTSKLLILGYESLALNFSP